jgi:hypothetical protein
MRRGKSPGPPFPQSQAAHHIVALVPLQRQLDMFALLWAVITRGLPLTV